MKQIYNFEQVQPPVLNESMIRLEMKKRRLRRQIALLAVAAILILIAVILLGLYACKSYPWIALFCFAHALITATGGSIMVVVFTRKGGQLIWL